MRRPAELAHRLHPLEAVAAGGEQLGIARKARGVAADIGNRRHLRCCKLLDLFLGTRAGRVEYYRAEAVEFTGYERPPEQVAMLGRHQRARAVRRAAQ